jgi:uncharacterized protein (DUF433 family)
MTREDFLQRISIDPNICSGKPCIRGTRIWVALIIENLAAGVPEAEILNAYPALTVDDIQAAIAMRLRHRNTWHRITSRCCRSFAVCGKRAQETRAAAGGRVRNFMSVDL